MPVSTTEETTPTVDRATPSTTTQDDRRRNELLQCQFSAWYPALAGVTFPSVILPIADYCDLRTFRQWLARDGIQLPRGGSTTILNHRQNPTSDDEWSTSSSSCDIAPQNEAVATAPEEPEESLEWMEPLTTAIQEAMATFRPHAALPKLNWSSPKDAKWIHPNSSLKCQTAGDVYLLLQCSDFCSNHDAHQALLLSNDSTSDADWPLELVLRQWHEDLYPSHEFRCFVANHRIVAISQRYECDPQLLLGQHTTSNPDDLRSSLVSQMQEFYEDKIQPRLSQLDLPDQYTMDVYLDPKSRRGKIWLIDINVWGPPTDALLYEWSELEQLVEAETPQSDPDLRLYDATTAGDGNVPIRSDPLSSYRAPIDTLALAQGIGKDFMSLCERPSVLEREAMEEAANIPTS